MQGAILALIRAHRLLVAPTSAMPPSTAIASATAFASTATIAAAAAVTTAIAATTATAAVTTAVTTATAAARPRLRLVDTECAAFELLAVHAATRERAGPKYVTIVSEGRHRKRDRDQRRASLRETRGYILCGSPANRVLGILHGLESDEAEATILARLRVLGQEAVGHGAKALKFALQVLILGGECKATHIEFSILVAAKATAATTATAAAAATPRCVITVTIAIAIAATAAVVVAVAPAVVVVTGHDFLLQRDFLPPISVVVLGASLGSRRT